MAVQASVEGVGVPVAIGATGVVLMVMNALDLGTSAIVVFALVLCAAWTVAGDHRLPRLPPRARGTAAPTWTRRRRRASPSATTSRRRHAGSLLTDDVRDVRLGLDLAVTANLSPADLADLAEHDDRDIRLLALGQLARRGDDDAATEAVAIARSLAASADDTERRAAALVLADVHPPDREDLLRRLLRDADVTVRIAALDSVGEQRRRARRRRGRRASTTRRRCRPRSTRRAGSGRPALALAADRLARARLGVATSAAPGRPPSTSRPAMPPRSSSRSSPIRTVASRSPPSPRSLAMARPSRRPSSIGSSPRTSSSPRRRSRLRRR